MSGRLNGCMGKHRGTRTPREGTRPGTRPTATVCSAKSVQSVQSVDFRYPWDRVAILRKKNQKKCGKRYWVPFRTAASVLKNRNDSTVANLPEKSAGMFTR